MMGSVAPKYANKKPIKPINSKPKIIREGLNSDFNP